MQLPTLNPDTSFQQLLQDLPPDCLSLARELKAFTRSRKIQTPLDLLRLVLLYCGEDHSLRQVAGQITLLTGKPISDTASKRRLLASTAWVKALLPNLLHDSDLQALPPGRLLITDSTSIVAPGAKGTQYRLHLTLNLLTLEFIALKITDKHTAESLAHVPIAAHDIILADRFYARRQALIEARERGGDFIVRHHPRGLPVYAENGERVDLIKELSDQAEQTLRTISGEISADDGRRLRVNLHSYRLSQKAEGEARRKLRYERRKSKNGAKPQTLFYAGFVIVLTTIAPEQMKGEEVMKAYRCRWQIEVAIKRWKSLLEIDELRAREKSELAEVWLSGKLVYALMIERRLKRLSGAKMERLDEGREATWWRLWRMMREEVGEKVKGSQYWKKEAWSECVRVMSERKRKRKLQQVPEQAIQYLRRSREFDEQEGIAA